MSFLIKFLRRQFSSSIYSRLSTRNRRDVSGDFRFAVIDAQSIPHDDWLDAVIANHMPYHVPDIPRAVAEVRRVLKPDGKFQAGTNGLGDLGELRELLTAFSLENDEALLATSFAQIELPATAIRSK